MKRIFLFTLLTLSLGSCILNKGYVPTGYDSSGLTKKGDHRLLIAPTAGKTKVQFAYGLSDNSGLVVNCSGAKGLYGGEVLYTRFRSDSDNVKEFGIGMGYLETALRYSYRPPLVIGLMAPACRSYTSLNANVSTQSIIGVYSIKHRTRRGHGVGFTCKTAFNYIYNYTYDLYVSNYEGRDNCPQPLDKEFEHFTNAFYLSAEPCFNFFSHFDRSGFRMQLGFALHTTARKHDYSYAPERPCTHGPVTNATAFHPRYEPVIFSIGYAFFFNGGREGHEERMQRRLLRQQQRNDWYREHKPTAN